MFPRGLPNTVPRRLFKLTDDRVLCFILPTIWHHGKTVPFLSLTIAVLELVQGVVEWVELLLLLACDAQNGAGLRVALDFDLLDFDSLKRLLGDDVQTVSGAVGGGVGARGLGVVEAEQSDCLLCATCCVVEPRCETETAIVLGQGFFLVPIICKGEVTVVDSSGCLPVLCNDGVAQNLLLGGAILALLGERRLVLLLLEFATHLVRCVRICRVPWCCEG